VAILWRRIGRSFKRAVAGMLKLSHVTSWPLVLASVAVLGCTHAVAQVVDRVEVTGNKLPLHNFWSDLDLYGRPGFARDVDRVSDTPGGAEAGDPPTPPSADKNTDPKCKASSPVSKRPVKLATGEKHLTHVDLRTAGLYGFEFSRTYRSGQRVGRLFGPNWLSSYEPAQAERSVGTLSTPYGLVPAWFAVVQPDGTRWTYTFDEIYGQGCPPNDPNCSLRVDGRTPWAGRENLTRDSLPTPQTLPAGTPVYRVQGSAATGFLALTGDLQIL
jgi:hypothetical protein